MNTETSFPDHQHAESTSISAFLVTPTAQMLPEPVSPEYFDEIQDMDFFATEQSCVDAGNGDVWRYDLIDSHQPHGNIYHEQSYHDQYLPENPPNFEPGYQQVQETNFVVGTRRCFTPDSVYPSTEAVPSFDTEQATSSPNQLNNDNAVDAVGDVEAIEAVNNLLIDKEKQARAVLKKQRSQGSMIKQMGESVSIVQTATGIKFGGVYWTAPADDDTIPSSPLEINARIDTLTKAMQNKKNCREKTTTGQYRNRWSEDSTYYPDEAFKAAARELVVAMVDIHQNGWTKTIYDKGERENCQATMYYTFEDRFEAVRELLHCSKTTCQDILKGTRFHTIIGNPRTLTFRTATNKNANAHKAELIAKGKKSPNGEEHSSDQESSHDKDLSNSGEQANSEESLKRKKPSKSKNSSKNKKRTYEDASQAVEEPGVKAPRPKAATKKRRRA